MLAEVAYVKLGWVLGHTKDLKKVKEMMLTNYAYEINDRIGKESFLR
jgi:glutamyl-tRNA(Gln) amidotransferase subunit D